MKIIIPLAIAGFILLFVLPKIKTSNAVKGSSNGVVFHLP